MQASHARL
jgi:hypothetical protein